MSKAFSRTLKAKLRHNKIKNQTCKQPDSVSMVTTADAHVSQALTTLLKNAESTCHWAKWSGLTGSMHRMHWLADFYFNVMDNNGSIADTKNVFHLYHQSFKMQNKQTSNINQHTHIHTLMKSTPPSLIRSGSLVRGMYFGKCTSYEKKRWNINVNETSIKPGMFIMCKYYA